MKIQIPNEVREVATNNTRKQSLEFFELAKSKLNGMTAVGFWGERHRVDAEDFIFDGQHIKVLPVKVLCNDRKEEGKTVKRRTGFYVAFDVDKIELNSIVELKVPKDKKGMFVGTGAWQVAHWCRKLGLKKINVVGI